MLTDRGVISPNGAHECDVKVLRVLFVDRTLDEVSRVSCNILFLNVIRYLQ